MDPSRANLLESTLYNLRISGISLSELLLYVLHQCQDPSHPALRDLIDNAKSIPAALSYHPATTGSITAWANDYIRAHYSGELQDLSDTDTDWHFGAMHTKLDQIRTFRIEDMAVRMRKIAPKLWSLIYTLLLGVDSKREDLDPAFQDFGTAGADECAEVESDSDGEYWEVEDVHTGVGTGEAHTSAQRAKKRCRRMSRVTFAGIKTVVILSILMQSRDPQCNALQSIVGIFLHSCNAPEKLIKVLSRMGISISLTSIHRAVHSLSKYSKYDIQTHRRSLLNTFTFNNFDILLKVLIATVDSSSGGLVHLTLAFMTRLDHGVSLNDLKCSALVWDRSEYNLHARDPRPFDPQATMELIYQLHPEPDLPKGSLLSAGRFRSWVFAKTLCQFGPTFFTRYAHELVELESVESIPVVKSHYIPLRAMDINQSTVSGNIEAIQTMFKQAGIGDPHRAGSADVVDLSEFMTIIFGDLGTYEQVLSAIKRRSIENTPYNRLQSVAFGMGLFHLKMAAADMIWRLLVEPGEARRDETSFMKIAGRLRPNESSQLVNGATFCQQHELIAHVGMLLRLDAWRAEVKRRTGHGSLEEWAATEPSLEVLGDIANTLARDYAEGEGLDLYDFGLQSAAARDEVRENIMRVHNYILLYEELAHAMNVGDVGRLETVLGKWIPLFWAAGKHKYGTQTLRFMHALYFIYPERLRRAIRYNILVNPSGQKKGFRAADWVNEFLNYLTKVTYGGEGSNYTKERILEESGLVLVYRNSHANMERNFALPGLTTKHADKDMRVTFKEILKYIEKAGAHNYEAGRTLHYLIPDALTIGSAMIVREASKGLQSEEFQDEAGSLTPKEQRGEEELEVTMDDLSVEGDIM